MRRHIAALAAILAVLLIVALSALPGGSPVVLGQTVPGERVFLPVIHRALPTATPTATPTQTPIPTLTPTPTLTAMPTSSPTPTVTPAPGAPVFPNTIVRFRGSSNRRFELVVTESFWATEIRDGSAVYTPTGSYLIVFGTITNVDLESGFFGEPIRAKEPVFNRLFDLAPTSPQWAAQRQYHRMGNYDTYQPGFSPPSILVWDVITPPPGQAAGAWLLLATSPW